MPRPLKPSSGPSGPWSPGGSWSRKFCTDISLPLCLGPNVGGALGDSRAMAPAAPVSALCGCACVRVCTCAMGVPLCARVPHAVCLCVHARVCCVCDKVGLRHCATDPPAAGRWARGLGAEGPGTGTAPAWGQGLGGAGEGALEAARGVLGTSQEACCGTMATWHRALAYLHPAPAACGLSVPGEGAGLSGLLGGLHTLAFGGSCLRSLGLLRASHPTVDVGPGPCGSFPVP